MSFNRAIGYCLNTECENYSKGVFLINPRYIFYCQYCTKQGKIVKEQGFTERVGDTLFKEVRVEFNFDPISHRFKDIAVVRDEAVYGTGSKYTLLTPMIKTENRALRVAEALLSSLQRKIKMVDGEIPRSSELILSFDEDFDIFSNKVKKLGKSLENSHLSSNKSKDMQPIYAED